VTVSLEQLKGFVEMHWTPDMDEGGSGGTAGVNMPDVDAFKALRTAYLENLDPEDMFKLDLSLGSNHPTMLSVCGLLHDGERDEFDLTELISSLWEKYGTREAREGEIEEIVAHTLKKEPCRLTLPDDHPLVTSWPWYDGLKTFSSQEAYDEHMKNKLYTEYKSRKAAEASESDDRSSWFFEARDLVGAELPRQRILVSSRHGTPVWRSSFLSELFAYRGVGKSAFAMGLIGLLLKGGEFLDYRSDGGAKVLYVDGELPLIQLQERLKTFIGDTQNLWCMSAERMPNQIFPPLIEPALQTKFLDRVSRLSPDVIILDTLTAVGKFDTNDADAWRVFNSFLMQLRFKGYCVIVVHHSGKNGTQRGRTDAEDNMDLVIQLTPPEGHDPGDGLKANVNYTKVRYGGRLQNFACEFVDGLWRMVSDSEENEIIALVNSGKSLRSIARSLGVSLHRVRTVRTKAKAKGLLLSETEMKARKPVKSAEQIEFEQSVNKIFN
jgi:hypothetical protein